ncbi:MAG: DUF3987 domain-containing protein [Planctomycetes bacterium]|nr:DUF3987 domain-containing protein [Planctomycetota bacterium]
MQRRACSMRGRGCDTGTIEVALIAENLKRCKPPLDEQEVRRIALSAGQYEADASRSGAEIVVANQVEAWEPPVPLGRFDLPEFPIEAFPRQLCALCEFCASVANSYQVPVDLPALLALAVCGAALAKRIEIRDEADWWEPVNLFIAIALESGERKSATFRAMVAPLAEAERVETERSPRKLKKTAPSERSWRRASRTRNPRRLERANRTNTRQRKPGCWS